MPRRPTDEQLWRQLVDTFDQLTVWGERVKQPFGPKPGTALGQDAEIFHWKNTADLAWQALLAAQDHLKGARVWMTADPIQLFPIATFSVLRSAMIGGAVASWMLFPDDAEARFARSSVVALDWYRNHGNYGKTITPIAADPEAHAHKLQHSQDRMKEVKDLRAARSLTAYPRTTEIIEKITNELWPYSADRTTATMALWQAGSGDAHALGWPVLSRDREMTPADDGIGKFVGRPSIKDVYDAYMCSYDFTAYGFRRLDELSEPLT